MLPGITIAPTDTRTTKGPLTMDVDSAHFVYEIRPANPLAQEAHRRPHLGKAVTPPFPWIEGSARLGLAHQSKTCAP